MSQGPRKNVRERQRGALGQRVRDLRVAHNLTQVELAVEIGVSRAHIAKIETNGHLPGLDVLEALARAFGVTMEFLKSGATGAPKNGRFVDDPDELSWLGLWASIPASERPRVLRLLRAAALDKVD